MKVKVYLHLEGEEVSYTITQYVTEETTVQDLLVAFADGLKESYGSSYSGATLTLKDEDGKVLNSTKKSLCDLVNSGDDLFVFSSQPKVISSQVLSVMPPAPSAVILSGTDAREDAEDSGVMRETIDEDCVPSPSKSSKAKAKAKAKARARERAKASSGDSTPEPSAPVPVTPIGGSISAEQKNMIQSLIKKKSFKAAREIAEVVLESVNPDDAFTLKALATILYESKHYDKAIVVCKRALVGNSRSLELNYVIAQCLFATKQYKEAKAYVTVALAMQARRSDLPNDVPEHMKNDNFRFDLIALQAECVFELGQHNEAVAIINQVTSNTASASNVPILIAYSSFALHYNKLEEPTRALLKAVIMGEDHRVRKLLAKLISYEEGMAEILRQVPPSTTPGAPDRRGKSEVYAFLGYVAKCHSAIAGGIRLYRLALEMLPASTSCALNLIHMYEISGDYGQVLRVVRDFCRTNASVGLGANPAAQRNASKGIATLTCGEFLQLLDSPVTSVSTSRTRKPLEFRWVQLEETYGYVDFDQPTATAPGSEEGTPVVPAVSRARSGGKYVYSHEELDLLAFFATAVKILFLSGQLHLLPGLYRALEPCRMQTEKPLHETTIRNEMAYFQQIAQLMCYRVAHNSHGLRGAVPSSSSSQSVLADLSSAARVSLPGSTASASSTGVSDLPPLFREAAARPIYILGDSHCVTPSWSILTVQGRPRLLIPRLSTGVKQWHLRAESTFYPKFHFRQMVALIPRDSEVKQRAHLNGLLHSLWWNYH
jgi:tetratricopeptide (TPR) repeat protein